MKNEVRRNSIFFISWLFLAFSIFQLTQLSQTKDFFWLVFYDSIAFIAYLILLSQAPYFPKKWLYTGFAFLALLCFWHLPYLSNDFYRFLWDGEMMQMGWNPYDFTPTEFIQTHPTSDCYLLDLYAGMGELSQKNYSCYPTVNQFYFYVATFFSNNLFVNVSILRFLTVITALGGIYFLEKLLQHFQLESKRIFILLLNPLVLLEAFGNLHFELVMVCFFLAAIYFLLTKKWLLSALFLSLSVHVKLIPLFFLPFVLPYLGWRKSVRYYAYTGIITLLFFLVFLRLDNVGNFVLSLRLYFKEFEFNSFLLYPYVQWGIAETGYNMTTHYAPKLARIALILMVGIAWNRKYVSAANLIKRAFLGLMVYYFLTSTVHPWYWILPLSLSLFHFSWSLIFITWLSILSYGLYDATLPPDFRQILMVINFGLLLLFFWEWFQPEKFQKMKLDILN